MMGMYFKWSSSMKNILFEGWDTTSTADASIAFLIAVVFTFLFEGAKVVKSYLIIRREQSPLTYGNHHQLQQEQHTAHPVQAQHNVPQNDFQGSLSSTAELLSSLKIPASIEQIRQWKISLFVMESVIHIINFLYGYILMLLVMTYNLWFLLAILIGSGIGFFIFNPVQQMYAEKYLKNKRSGTCETQHPGNPYSATINSQLSQEETERMSIMHQTSRSYESFATNE